jgi:hypothetical protein
MNEFLLHFNSLLLELLCYNQHDWKFTYMSKNSVVFTEFCIIYRRRESRHFKNGHIWLQEQRANMNISTGKQIRLAQKNMLMGKSVRKMNQKIYYRPL